MNSVVADLIKLLANPIKPGSKNVKGKTGVVGGKEEISQKVGKLTGVKMRGALF